MDSRQSPAQRPIAALTGIRMESGGHPLEWQRDPVDMYAFHVKVPAGLNEIEVSLDGITAHDSAGAEGPAASSNLLDLNWNAGVLYPRGGRSDDVQFSPSVTLPTGWKSGTALTATHAAGNEVEFENTLNQHRKNLTAHG